MLSGEKKIHLPCSQVQNFCLALHINLTEPYITSSSSSLSSTSSSSLSSSSLSSSSFSLFAINVCCRTLVATSFSLTGHYLSGGATFGQAHKISQFTQYNLKNHAQLFTKFYFLLKIILTFEQAQKVSQFP